MLSFRFAPGVVSVFASGIAAVIVGAGCRGSGADSQTPGLPPPSVTVAPVEIREIVEHDEFTARLDAPEVVEIRPRVSGYLTEVRFRSGELVQAGDVLFVIDPRPKQAVFDRADAEVTRARVRLENSAREAKRADALHETKAISIEEADQRRWAYTDAQAAMQVAEAARETARLDLEYCTVRAPISGRVSRALVTPGNNVSGVDGFTTLMTTLVSVDPMYAYSDVDEASLQKFRGLLREGRLSTNSQGRIEVEMALAGETGFPHQGFIESIDNRLDPATGSILVRTEFPNPDGRLIPGLFARVRLPGSAKMPALLISETAIGTDQNQKFVLTLTSSNTVAYRPVTLGGSVGGMRIVREGLRAGESVVVNGLMRVRPGMPVTPQPLEVAKLTAQR
ncbi:MAG TPA: efflux RND transporter periplasmic adaptor subunit [Verrucomicrobiota bacterium]|nr:efflux transporter periplasmic adaptor subunit [Verrucomicrobiales bacterium]HRI13890.1 efflux RND transporter periplasmic adaptor subunit [Verrucomicrobiota bacterium]